jgi:hypothetical protein
MCRRSWTGLGRIASRWELAGSLGNELARMGASAVREVARICRGEALHHEVQADAYERLA